MSQEKMTLLADAIGEASRFLARYDRQNVASGLTTLEEQLRAGDVSAIISAVSEATGSTGSLNDQYLYPEEQDQGETVNAELRALVDDIERKARAAAAACKLILMR
jgi:hypothetical protein